MSKNTALFGAISISCCVAAASAQAKLIRYEINGQRYSYSTNNRQQTKEARARIEAAAAPGAARSRADADGAANPLARIFGSQAQKDAVDAQARAQQVAPAETQPEVASTSSLRRSRGAGRASARQASAREEHRQERRQEHRQALREARLERQKAARVAHAQKLAARTAVIPADRPRKEPETTSSIRQPVRVLSSAPAVETPSPVGGRSAESPTKEAGGGSLTDFVNQVRKAPTDEGAPRL
jgi:hypothetical protein